MPPQPCDRSPSRSSTGVPPPQELDRWRAVPMQMWPEEAFAQSQLRNPYRPGNLTLPREAVAATRHLAGAVVECGVYQGQSLATLAWLMREWGDPRRLIGFDSFQGFPAASSQDLIDGGLPPQSQPSYYAKTSVELVEQFLVQLDLADHVTLVPGFFSETLPAAPVEAISVLLLDCDLYDSYRVSLQHLYPKVQRGGWIIFDEYFSPKYPGARVAVDEFFAGRPEKPRLAAHLLAEHPYERWYVVKS